MNESIEQHDMSFIDKEIGKYRFAIEMTVALILFIFAWAALLSIQSAVSPKIKFAEVHTWYFVMHAPEKIAGMIFSRSPEASNGADAKGIPVLLYHGEGDTSDMPANVFRGQLKALRDDGWKSITMQEFSEFMKGKRVLPKKSFLLTFDDGRADTFYTSDPILKDFGFTGVMFAVTGFSMPENGDLPLTNFYLSKAELQLLERTKRWEVESHGDKAHFLYDVPTTNAAGTSHTIVTEKHFLSNKFWVEDEHRLETDTEFRTRITNDLQLSKDLLSSALNKKITAYAYPYNDYGQGTVNYPLAESVIKKIGPTLYDYLFYQVAINDTDFLNYPGNSHEIKRIEPLPVWTGETLVELLNRDEQKTP